MRWATVLVAVSAIGLCGASEPPKQPSDKQQEAQAANAQGKPAPPAPASAPPKNVEQAPPSKERRQDDEGAPGRHLQEYGLYATIAQAIIGIVGLVGLFFTVLYAKRAWGEAKRSADASRDGLADARSDAAEQARRFEAQLHIATENLKIAQRAAAETDRAWLSLTVTPIGALQIDDDKISIKVSVVTKNVGKGPAIGVENTAELAFDVFDLDRTIRQNPGLQILSGRFGEIIFPDDDRRWEGVASVSREAMAEAIAADRASDKPIGVYPSIVAGVRYCLPGDNTRRLTYIYLSLAKRADAKASFDEGDTSLDLADLTWCSDLRTGPVT
ncbi:MAG: hypothetical protein KA085_12965 [Phenylobacterium sp.]|uniref:hypothetical protein n=1 Tax=Phenylobacterium sp. TaxID=1871053 RepID=UPI001B664375|nr:hypothetical protein [Phenylobacterium sp.]MBP7648919.1 hypothetical protein [Phenylobacterium sp.]MBP7817035.1 hypothetical protein [Phenylobacterium sp.]MBP9231917.1 hypothetical protein [Phenylobacterium sp.]MBP9753487.1 hypothetical protein [Phenylobacterium sp.]